MANLNLAQVIGYLGDDCNRANKGITTLPNGDVKYTFSIATSDKLVSHVLIQSGIR